MKQETSFERQFKQTKSENFSERDNSVLHVNDYDDDFINSDEQEIKQSHKPGMGHLYIQNKHHDNIQYSFKRTMQRQQEEHEKRQQNQHQDQNQQNFKYSSQSPAVKYQNYYSDKKKNEQSKLSSSKQERNLKNNYGVNQGFNNHEQNEKNQRKNIVQQSERNQTHHNHHKFFRKTHQKHTNQQKKLVKKNIHEEDYQNTTYQKINENFDKKTKLAWLYKYLQQKQIQNGDYVKVNIFSTDFCPIFRIQKNQKQLHKLYNQKEKNIGKSNQNSKIKTKTQQNQQKNLKDNKNNSLLHSQWDYGNHNKCEMRLLGGSQIFLKYQNIVKFNIEKIKSCPSFQYLYVQINIPGNGLLACHERPYTQSQNKKTHIIMFQDEQSYQNIWRCQMINSGKINEKSEIKAYLVKFINLKTQKMLCINDKGDFYADDVQNQFKFILRQKKNEIKQNDQQGYFNINSMYYIQPYGLLKSTNSNSKMLSYESNKQENRTSRIQVQILQLDDNFISIQQQIQYINEKLSENPTFQLIQTIFELMMPYEIQEFNSNLNIVSHEIKDIFVQNKISEIILDFLLDKIQECTTYIQDQFDRIEEVDELQELDMSENLEGHKKQSQFSRNSNKIKKKTSKYLRDNNIHQQKKISNNNYQKMSKKQSIYAQFSLNKIFSYLNILCMDSSQNSKIFLPLLNLLFQNVLYNYSFIVNFVQGNKFFTDLFYKKEWYHILIKELMLFNEEQICMDNLLPYFKVFQAFIKVQNNNSKLYSPNLVNQLLLFHTLNNPQFQQKKVALNIYVEGVYIFIHQNQIDMQLRTYIQSSKKQKLTSSQLQNIELRKTSSQNSNSYKMKKRLNLYRESIIANKMFRKSTIQYSTNQKIYQSLKTVIGNIDLIGSIAYGYNINILKYYEKLINTLFSYCYKSNFPLIKNVEFKKSVIRLINCFDVFPSKVKLEKRYRVGVVDIPHNKNLQRKPKSKRPFTLLSIHNQHKKCPEVSVKDIKEMSFLFLTKCGEFYSNLKKKTIKIQELFHTKIFVSEDVKNGKEQDQQPIEEYFDVLFYIFKNKILKTKQKKKAQFMQYIQKIFQTLQTNSNVKQFNQENSSMTNFVNLLLEIIKFNPNYQNYLKYIKVKISYQNTIILQQKIFAKKNLIKNINLFKSQNEISKISMINLFNKSQKKKQIQQTTRQRSGALHRPISSNLSEPLFKVFEKDNTIEHQKKISNSGKNDINQSGGGIKNQINIGNSNMSLVNSSNKNSEINQENFQIAYYSIDQVQSQQNLRLQIRAVELLSLIFLNINEEYLEESVQTLNYFVKNPTIFNLSSFQLFESIPKYFNQTVARKIILEQWYLASTPEHFQSLTNLLRILHTKVSEHLINLKAICILDKEETADFYENISQIIQQLKKLGNSCSSWMKQQLYVPYPNPFNILQENLRSLCASLKESWDFNARQDIETVLNLKKILLNMDIITIFKQILNQVRIQFRLLNKKKQKFNPTHKEYKKKLSIFCSYIKHVILFFVQQFSIQNIQQVKMSREQFQQNLKCCQTVFCFLSDVLSQFSQFTQIFVYILKVGKKWYSYNFTVHFDQIVLQNIFSDVYSFCQLVGIWASFQDVDILTLADAYSRYLLKIDEDTQKQIVQLLTLTKNEQFAVDLNNQSLQSTQRCVEHQTNFFYFILKLKKIQKKININNSKLFILKWFDNNILMRIISNDDSEQIQSLKYKKNYNSQEYVNKISKIILKKRFIAYFIDIFLYLEYGMSKLSIRLNQQEQSNILTVNKYIEKNLIDTAFFSKIQQFISQEDLAENKQKNKSSIKFNNRFQTIFVSYLEYYVYDLCSLLSNLKIDYDIYDKVSVNLSRFHQKLAFFLQNTQQNSQKQNSRYYSKNVIQNLLSQLQEKQIISRMKSPREPVLDNSFELLTLQNKDLKNKINANIQFLDRKNLKKLKSVARRKWQKAIKSLQQGALNTQIQFLAQIQQFAQIYNIKSEESVSIIINNQDLMRKLIHTAFNFNKVLLSTQNKIFILNQLRKFFSTKTCQKLNNKDQTLRIIAVRMIESFNLQLKYENQPWKDNIYVVCLKLKIILQCKYFQNQYTLSDLQTLLEVLKKAVGCFWSDQLKIRLSISQYKDLYFPSFILYNPMIQVYQILGQIDVSALGITQLNLLATQLHKSILQNKINHKNLTNGVLYQKIVDKLLTKFQKQQKCKLIWNQIKKNALFQIIQSLQKSRIQ